MTIEPIFNFTSMLLLIGGINGLFFAWLLLQIRRSNIAANRYLAAILAANGLLLLNQFLVETDLMYEVPALLGASLPVEVVFPPTLYLYVRTMTQPDAPGQKNLMHFVPTLICLIMMAPFFFLDFEAKKAIAESNYVEWPGILAITVPIYMVILGLQFTIYLILAFKLLFAHTRNIAQFFSYREKITLSWLRNFLLLNVVTWIFGSYIYMSVAQSDKNIKQVMDMFFIYSVAVVFYLGTMGLLQRRIYTPSPVSGPDLPEEITDDTETTDNVAAPINTTVGKYKKSALTEDMSTRIIKRLTEVMETEKPYLNNNLALPDLAAMVATSPNYLSQVINEQLRMNFFDYVNSYRIETAKDLIINPLPHTVTVLDIAMESAFNSKSAFYSAFKKQVGITPAEFKKGRSL